MSKLNETQCFKILLVVGLIILGLGKYFNQITSVYSGLALVGLCTVVLIEESMLCNK